MRAQVIEVFGKPDVFRVVNSPDPQLGLGKVVAIAAISVNLVDYKLRHHGSPIAPALPEMRPRNRSADFRTELQP